MQVTVNGKALADAIKCGAYAKRGVLDIFQCAKLTASGTALTIETTDSEVYARTVIDARVDEPGVLCMRAELLAAACTDADVTLTAGHVKRGRSRLSVPTNADVSAFPSPDESEFTPIALDPVQLAMGIDVAGYAVNAADVRPQAQALCIAANTVAGGDGKQISMCDIDFPGPRLMLHADNLAAIRRMLAPGTLLAVANLRGAAAGLLRITDGANVLIVRLVDSAPFDYPKAMPSPTERWVTLRTKDMIAALRRFAPFSAWMTAANGQAMTHTAALSFGANGASMTSHDGASVEALDDAVREQAAEEVTVALNARLLMETLEHTPTDHVVLTIGIGGRGVLLEPEEKTSCNVRHALATVTLGAQKAGTP